MIINMWCTNIIWAQKHILANQTARLLSLESNNRKHNKTTSLLIMVILIVFGCFLFVWEQGFDLYVTPTIAPPPKIATHTYNNNQRLSGPHKY